MNHATYSGNVVPLNSTETLTVNHTRKHNDQARGRKHLLPAEVEQLCQGIKGRSRYPDRDELLVRMAFNHGLRVSELVDLKWQHLNLKERKLGVHRAKGSIDCQHPVTNKRELMLLNRLYKAQNKPAQGSVFRQERGGDLSRAGAQQLFGRLSERILGVKWNLHALRHGCATKLVEDGQDLRTIQAYMGHANIQNTVVYTHLSSRQFDSISF